MSISESRHSFTFYLFLVLFFNQSMAVKKSWNQIKDPKGSEIPVITALLEILQGPLENSTIFLSYDKECEQLIDINTLLKKALKITMINFIASGKVTEIHEWSDVPTVSFPPSIEHKPAVDTAVLLVGSSPTWIDRYENRWIFQRVIIVSLNPAYNVNLIFRNNIIQKSQNILVLKTEAYGNENKSAPPSHVNLYSSDSFVTKGKHMKVHLGEWNKTKFGTAASIFPDRFADFRGATIHISSDLDDYPLLVIMEDGSAAGMNMEIIRSLARVLNFSYTVTISAPDLRWGELENDTWSGLLGQVAYTDKHLTINYFTITAQRSQYFDFSVPYFIEGFGFALKTPPPYPPWQNLLNPFTWQVRSQPY